MSKPKRRVHTQERERPSKRSMCGRIGDALRWGAIAAMRPVDEDHFGLFAWPGPMLCDVEVGGAVPVHCFATKVVSFAEEHFAEAEAAGFEWVKWAQA